MMTLRFRIFLVILFVLVLLWLFRQVKKKKLDLRYTLSWLLLGIVLLLFALFPGLLMALSRFLGIYSPVNMIFFLGFCFSLLIIYTLTEAVSRQSDEIRKLTQALALLKDKIREEEKPCEDKEVQEGIAPADDV